MILNLLYNKSWVEVISPAFALICQYLSSTVRDLASSFSLHGERISRGQHHLHEVNNPWKQLLGVRRLNWVKLSAAEKLTQAEG